jgi:hypothetical protein
MGDRGCDMAGGQMSRFTTPQGGNKIYLTCSCGLDPLELCRRTDKLYSESKSSKYHFDDWLDKHSGCAVHPDHFRIGLEKEPNWDQAKLAEPVDNAVRLSLVNGNG